MNYVLIRDSLELSVATNKDHKHILRKIENLLSQTSNTFVKRNFTKTVYMDKNGQDRKLYLFTAPGLLSISLGLTGRDTIPFKEQLLNELSKGIIL